MNTFSLSPFHAFRVAALTAAVFVAGTAAAQSATLDVSCTPRLTPLQQRLYDTANDGPGTLRDFLQIRRGILQLDVYDTAAWADSINQARATCVKDAARTQAARTMALGALKN